MIDKNVVSAKAENSETKKSKQVRIKQTDIPVYTLEYAIKVPNVLWNECGGKPTAPFQVANSLGISPGSSYWKYLSGAAVAYGLTDGAYNSKEISLKDLGKKIVAPTAEGEDKAALFQAVMIPTILNKFYEFYDGCKLPKETIVKNKLNEFGVPLEKVDEVYDTVIKNAKFVEIIVNTKGGDFIHLSATRGTNTLIDGQAITSMIDESNEDEEPCEVPDTLLEKLNIQKESSIQKPTLQDYAQNEKLKVFISHGKNRTMVDQLKELLIFGQFQPIVSIERESTAIPVPEKVFNDMSQCQAGIIHIAEEQTLLDNEGIQHKMINENVLIEIGAAIAYYGKKVILLCHKGITLPSNLQGLYRCEYEGEQLDYVATMKLLKTFNEIRN